MWGTIPSYFVFPTWNLKELDKMLEIESVNRMHCLVIFKAKESVTVVLESRAMFRSSYYCYMKI